MFENKLIKTKYGLIETSRIIASWLNMKGTTGQSYRRYMKPFDEWLITLGIDEKDRRHIRNFASNGKLELEESARDFMEEQERKYF